MWKLFAIAVVLFAILIVRYYHPADAPNMQGDCYSRTPISCKFQAISCPSRSETPTEVIRVLKILESTTFSKEKQGRLIFDALRHSENDADLLTALGKYFISVNDYLMARKMFLKAYRYCHCDSRSLFLMANEMAIEHDLSDLAKVDAANQFYRKYIARAPFRLRAELQDHSFRMMKSNLVYDTVAIEGNTLDFETVAAFLSTDSKSLRNLTLNGTFRDLAEVVDAAEAFDFVMETFWYYGAKPVDILNLEMILKLHALTVRRSQPDIAGKLRISKHIAPPFDQVPGLMHDFVAWINSDQFNQLHPIEMAALAHFELVSIHPFIDGNGRAARLLALAILQIHGYAPPWISVKERDEYFTHIEDCHLKNGGDSFGFVRFIVKTVNDTIYAFIPS